MTVYRRAVSMQVLADALSETNNSLKLLNLSDLKISSRSEVEQFARGLKARVESLQTLTLEDVVLCGRQTDCPSCCSSSCTW
jgi:hypothetical protein